MEIWINVFNDGLIVGIFAMSLCTLVGTAGQLSVAPAGFGAVGAYAAARLAVTDGLGPGWALVAGIVAAGIAGLLIGAPALRLRLEHVILLTLAFATTIVAVFTAIPDLGGAYGLPLTRPVDWFGSIVLPSQFLKMTLPITLIAAFICWRMIRSSFGRVLRGIREDAEAVQSLGKDQVRYKIVIFVTTSSMAGAAGVLFFYWAQVVSPGQYGFSFTTTILAGVILGGTTSLFGSFIGAMVLTFISPVLQHIINISPTRAGLWQLAAYGAILIVVMRIRPGGLISEDMNFRKLGRRIAGSASMARLGMRPVPAGPYIEAAGIRSVDRLVDSGPQAEAPTRPPLAVKERGPSLDALTADAAAHRWDGHGEPIVVGRGLAKEFGGIHAVRNLDIALQPAKITALVGPNGAGKTSVFNLLTGRLPMDAGTVTLRGEDITGLQPHEIARRGLVRSFQDVRVFQRMSLLDNVALAVPDNIGSTLNGIFFRPFASRRGDAMAASRAMECLALVGLDRRADDTASVLGYGDQKLLALARLVATGADVFLIDEPASGIDRGNLGPVLDAIASLRERGATICIVEHNLDVVAQLADHVLFMEQGQVTAEGSMADIAADDRLAEVYFGHVRTAG